MAMILPQQQQVPPCHHPWHAIDALPGTANAASQPRQSAGAASHAGRQLAFE